MVLPKDPHKPGSSERFGAAFYRRFYGARATRVAAFEDYEVRARLLAAYAALLRAPVRRILDVGAGTGHFRKALMGCFKRAEYVGIEVSEYACERHGWLNRSIVDYAPAREFDLIVCHDVLQYLVRADAVRAIANLKALCAGLLYCTVLTREDWNDNCDQSRTDGDVNLRSAAWYRRRLADDFCKLGTGVYIANRFAGQLSALA
ncbi:MAG: class I SAM-dependent methyltransferase [Gammaproteobacteria bacterium]|nr:class I SAM-dependent methyltransferase [Gammaproteobacteria bacterium]